MKSPACARCTLFVVLAVAVFASGSISHVTPLQKAIEMLQGLLAKSKSGKHEEEVQYAAFKQFCDDVTTRKQQAIQEADQKIEALEAHVLKFNSKAERLAAEVTGHEGDVAGWGTDIESAGGVRKTEHDDYLKMHQNFTESIEAVAEAVKVLKEQSFDRPSAASRSPGSLLQEQAINSWMRLPPSVKKTIEVFLSRSMQREEPDLTFVVPPPQAAGYEFRSDDIISMLERLADKFRDELTALEREETSRRQFYEGVVKDFQNSIDAANANIQTKKREEAQSKQNSADASSNLQLISKSRGDDSSYLSDLQTTCLQKRTDFESRKGLRSEEIQALEKALELLSSDVVAGTSQRHLPASSFLSSSRKGSALLAQMRGSANTLPQQLRVAAFLANVSKRIGSNLLSTVASRARDDPFEKVKRLIQELISRLESEADEEETHKNWCDSELNANAQTRTVKSSEIESLTGQVDSMQAGIALLKRDIAEISASLAELFANIAKQTELRNREKKQNEQTIQEATDAQTALAEALNVLQEFYGKVSQATSFAQAEAGIEHQQRAIAAPPIFNSPFKGQELESNNVVAMLEVIQSDFARLEAETADAENAASNEYDTFMTESTLDKESKQGDLLINQNALKEQEGMLLTAQDDLNNAHLALQAAQAYFDELKPSCLNEGSTFQERNQRRDDEIASLKDALRILSGDDVAVVQGVLVRDQGSAGQSTLRSATTGLDYKQ